MNKSILSVDDLRNSKSLSQSRRFFRSSLAVSYSSRTPKERSPAENDKQKSEEPEEEIQELKSTVSKNLLMNQQLSKEINEISNSLSVSNVLCNSLKAQKDELLNQFMIRNNEYKKLQQERLQLMCQVSQLKSKVNRHEKKQQIQEQHTYSLSHNIQLLQDELNFEKSINLDLRQEYDKLREQLKKIFNDLKAYQLLKIEVLGIQKINREIKQKFKMLQSQLNETREKLRAFEEAEEREQEERKKIFTKIELLEQQNEYFKQKNQFFDKELKVKYKQLQRKYGSDFLKQRQKLKVTEEQEKRIKNLVHEVLVLSKKNKEYLDELDYYKNKLDEGSLYVTDKLKIRETDFNYMLKSLQLETQEVKNSLEMEVEEKERLRYELQNYIVNFNNKTNEVQNLLVVKESEWKGKENYYEKQIGEVKLQNEHLRRRVDQMIQNQHKLRSQISEKDRIIMEYVKK